MLQKICYTWRHELFDFVGELMKKMQSALVVGILAVIAMPSYAEPIYNHVSFETQVSQKVANDEIHMTLSKTAQANDTNTLANLLSKSANQALEIAKHYPDVKVTTGRQSTYPRYNNSGKIIGFTGSISLNVHSQNFLKASELAAKLQSVMTIDDLSFDVSDQAKQTIEKQLMIQATKKFQDEAKTISQAFGATNYKIVSIHLNNAHSPVAMPVMALRAKSAVADAAIEQNFQGGNSQLTYRITGTIELTK